MLGNVASRLLGFIRTVVIAALFGTTSLANDYFTALRINQSIYDLLISGVISAAFIPVFSGLRDDRAAFGRVGGTILTLTTLVMALAFGALELFTQQAVWILAPTAGHDTITVVHALRLLSPAVIFLGISGVLIALLYAKQRFIFPAFSPALFNLGIVVGAVALHRSLGINSLVIGVVVGAVAQVLLQAYGLRSTGLRLAFDLHNPRVRQIVRLALPVTLGLIVTQAQVLFDLRLAYSTGGVSVLQYATNLQQLPLGLVATAMSLASLPTLSTLEGAAFRATLARGLTLTLLLIVPAVVICGVLAEPLVAAAFHHGTFTAESVRQTADALRFYAIGLGFAAVDQLLIFAFYAKNDTRTPVLVGIVSIGCYLAVALPTLHSLSFRGLALADSAKQIGHATLLYLLLRRRYGAIEGLQLRGTPGKILVAGVAMALLCAVLLRLVGGHASGTFIHALLFVVVVGGAASTLYLALLARWSVPELTLLTDRLRRRLRRS